MNLGGIGCARARRRVSVSSILAIATLAATSCSTPCLPLLSDAVLPTDAAERLEAAEIALARGEPEDALDGFREVIRTHPDHFRAWRGEQDALLDLGRAEDALASASRRIEERGDATAQLLLARITTGEQRAHALAAARELEPDHPYLRLANGIDAARRGDFVTAEGEFSAALVACAPPVEARSARARARVALGKFDDAAADYREYVAERGDDLAARYEFATLLHRELNRRDEALDQYRAMLAIDPTSPEAIVGVAVIATLRGDTQEAERLYLEVAAREPVALLNLGLLYRDELNRKPEALACFRRYLAFEGDRAANRSATDRLFVVPNYVEELERELGGAAP